MRPPGLDNLSEPRFPEWLYEGGNAEEATRGFSAQALWLVEERPKCLWT